MKKKCLALLLSAAMVLSGCGFVSASAEAEGASETPSEPTPLELSCKTQDVLLVNMDEIEITLNGIDYNSTSDDPMNVRFSVLNKTEAKLNFQMDWCALNNVLLDLEKYPAESDEDVWEIPSLSESEVIYRIPKEAIDRDWVTEIQSVEFSLFAYDDSFEGNRFIAYGEHYRVKLGTFEGSYGILPNGGRVVYAKNGLQVRMIGSPVQDGKVVLDLWIDNNVGRKLFLEPKIIINETEEIELDSIEIAENLSTRRINIPSLETTDDIETVKISMMVRSLNVFGDHDDVLFVVKPAKIYERRETP